VNGCSECSKSVCHSNLPFIHAFSLMNLDELAFISLTKSDKALFGFKPLEYERGLAFH
jgi:hypothetical protein